MALLFKKFQEAVKVLAKSPTFAKDGRHLQFEADINRLFLCTSYNRLGKNAVEADADEIVDLASKASLFEQQKQVQDNIHDQLQTFCTIMDQILVPVNSPIERKNTATLRSGLGLAIGRNPLYDDPAIPVTNPLKQSELSKQLKDLFGYTLQVKPSQIPHEDAGQGLFIDGEADLGSIIAIYPGVVYSPAYYRYIPGYPRVDLQNPYLITRYDGTVINAKPWGLGAENREIWDGSTFQEYSRADAKGDLNRSDRLWKLLSKPLDGSRGGSRKGEILERRNPLAFAHFANHPAKGSEPNVMVCSYDFPLTEKNMRSYIPNVAFGSGEEVGMKKFGSFWFKSWKSSSVASSNHVPILKSLVLVATKGICNEEVFLNYRLSNLKNRPSWYVPVDEDEDRRRWS